MADVQQNNQPENRRRRRPTLQAPRIDMTPMVDLAFLLLTFFVLTAELNKQKAISLAFPAEGESMKVNGLTVLVGKHPEKIFWYRGEFTPGMHLDVTTPGKDGLRKVLADANRTVFENLNVINRQYQLGLLNETAYNEKRSTLRASKSVPFVVIKWTDDASYGRIVDVIDELNRTANSKYAVVKASEAERALIR
ncbi:MAG: biopolymer transporter ExbD [Bacteroidetes bacterium]|nr:biopolymer transporter ExbD [Bacteroidota bacterium]